MENLEEIYNRIVTGTSVIETNGRFYLVKDPRPKDKIIGRHVYNAKYTYFLRNHYKTQEEQSCLLEERKVWHEKFDKIIEDLNYRRKNCCIEIERHKLKDGENGAFVQEKSRIDADLQKLSHKKNALLYKSAEYMAKIEEYKYYIFLLTFDLWTQEKIWKTLKEFEQEDENLVRNLLTQTYLNTEITDSIIRRAARSEPWRSTWLTANKTGNLFDHPLSSMTDLQRSLVSWSLLYDNVYENPDRPADNIINNDVLLDDWLEKEHNKNKTKRETGVIGLGKNSKINNAQEVGIIVNSLADAQRVYDMNSPQAKGILKARDKQIMTAEITPEGRLVDVHRDLQLRKNRLEKSAIKNKFKP